MSRDQASIRQATLVDAEAIAGIYNYYVANSHISFETEDVSGEEMGQRIEAVLELGLPWLIARSETELLGYAYASQWKRRQAYAGTLEVTVYVANGLSGKGIGSALYGELFSRLQQNGCHTAIGTIALPNEGSVRLHERFGMRKVGEFKEAGYKEGEWIDVGYWQRLF